MHRSRRDLSNELRSDRVVAHRWLCRVLTLWGAVTFMGSAGCGTDFSEVVFQTGSSAGFTVLDLFLTDAANAMADQFGDDKRDSTGGAEDDGNGGDDDGVPASPGEQAYQAQNCGACHGQAAEGGSALALAGMDELAALEARFDGGATHMGTALTDQEVADVADWLAGL